MCNQQTMISKRKALVSAMESLAQACKRMGDAYTQVAKCQNSLAEAEQQSLDLLLPPLHGGIRSAASVQKAPKTTKKDTTQKTPGKDTILDRIKSILKENQPRALSSKEIAQQLSDQGSAIGRGSLSSGLTRGLKLELWMRKDQCYYIQSRKP